MCESFKTNCVCGQKTAEIFFGKMVLAESSVAQVYCPKCSQDIESGRNDRVWDNDWILEMDMDVLRTHPLQWELHLRRSQPNGFLIRGMPPGSGLRRMIPQEEIRSARKSRSLPKPICMLTTRP